MHTLYSISCTWVHKKSIIIKSITLHPYSTKKVKGEPQSSTPLLYCITSVVVRSRKYSATCHSKKECDSWVCTRWLLSCNIFTRGRVLDHDLLLIPPVWPGLRDKLFKVLQGPNKRLCRRTSIVTHTSIYPHLSLPFLPSTHSKTNQVRFAIIVFSCNLSIPLPPSHAIPTFDYPPLFHCHYFPIISELRAMCDDPLA